MNRLILIGNGFDLAHGLKTSYTDFILDYLTLSINSAMVEGDYEDQLISISNENAKILQKNIDLKTANDSELIREILDFKDVDGRKVINFRSELFRDISENFRIFHWFEIENAYSNILLAYVKNTPDYITDINQRNHFSRFKKMNDEFEFLKELLIAYINKIYPKFDRSNLSDKIHNMLFRKDDQYSYNINEDATMVLNFNYTNLIENYTDTNNFRLRINNIHGNIENPENILFGFGDSSHEYYKKMFRIPDQEALRHFKTITPYSLDIVKNTLNFLDLNYFQVVVAGHSCSITDEYILGKIFNHSKCTSVRILHHTDTNNKNDYKERLHNITSHLNSPDSIYKIVLAQQSEDHF